MIKVTFKMPTYIETDAGSINAIFILCNKVVITNDEVCHSIVNDVMYLGKRISDINKPEFSLINPTDI